MKALRREQGASFRSLADVMNPQTFGRADLVCEEAIKKAHVRAAAMQIGATDAQIHIRRAVAQINKAYDQCESPIEKQMLPALVFSYYGEQFASFPATVHCPKQEQTAPKGDLIVIPQFAFIKYRLDFAVMGEFDGHRKIVAVECDGQEFHQDKVKDCTRDAYLHAFGIDVLHFSGADIHADPFHCAMCAAEVLVNWRASLK